MTREEKQKAIDALKISAPIMAITQEEFNDYIQTLNTIIDWLEQEPCKDVPDINDGNVYQCSCGYGWDKSKVVRHHFCPNCGKPVDSSIKPCEDCISRQAVLDMMQMRMSGKELYKAVYDLPTVTPQPKIGRWIKVTNGRGGHECDLCHDYAPSYQSGDEYLSKHCPNCGAKMEKEE